MAKKLSYERYAWFHGQVKAGAFPNAARLAEQFEISRKQAQRDVAFMKDRLGAPLLYHHAPRGFGYEDGHYELPPFWLREEELRAFCLALRLAAAIPDRDLKAALHQLLEKFLSLRSADATPPIRTMEEKVSVKNVAYSRVPEPVFHAVVGALFADRTLQIVYHTPHKNETTERLIRPLHLLCYMGNWHLVAFCGLRGEIRDFALSRIRSVQTCPTPLPLPAGLPSIKAYLRRNFGVIAGKRSTEVTLRFAPGVSPWVAEQEWHEAQQVSRERDGSLRLTFPVSGFVEVIREILRFGAGVEVLAPKELREEVRKEIGRMGRLYRQPTTRMP
ncbi:MAG: YafY family transcriptional regulator [Deltaproteobacteria bacterium]|nr:YafY family transcriptional regulator [Deltaproteobacteria bacterium]